MSNRLLTIETELESPTPLPAKRTSLRDVAAAAGLTSASVSRVLNGKGRESPQTRERVQRIARELGYSPDLTAQRLKGQGQRSIAIYAEIDLGVGTRKIEALQRIMITNGFDVTIHSGGFSRPGFMADSASMMRSIRQMRPLAILCMGYDLQGETLEEARRYQEQGGIVVCYSHNVSLDCDNVFFDTGANTELAVQHLIALGHKKIGLFWHGHNRPHGARYASFCEAMREANLPVREDWMLSPGIDGVNERAGEELAKQFLAMDDKPTGVCILNDLSAASFVNHVLRAGLRVPDDVSVVGHDDLPAAEHCIVPLTTVSHPIDEIARDASAMLLSRIDGSYSGSYRNTVLVGHLVVRESTSAMR